MDSRLAVGVVTAALTAFAAAPATAAKDDLLLVSKLGQFGPAANAAAAIGKVSADGRYVAFQSTATNLSPDDVDGYADVFLRDLLTQEVTLVSRATGPAGAAGDLGGSKPSMSADGRYVAFVSASDNLSTEDNDAHTNIYVRDVVQGSTTFVSREDGVAGAPGDGASDNPGISPDGRFVVFESVSNNLSGLDSDTYENVFIRDTLLSKTSVVNRTSLGAAGDGNAYEPDVSSDGRYVTFASDANNLSGADDNTFSNIFKRDTVLLATTLVSRASGETGAGGDNGSYEPSISADGRFIAFRSDADNFEDAADDLRTDMFVRDALLNTTMLVSRESGENGPGGTANSASPEISLDGRHVAFESSADNLSSADDNAVWNIFVRDLDLHTTTFVNRASGPNGAPDDAGASNPSPSADGRFVVFSSLADGFSSEDDNAYNNLFLRDVLGAPPLSSSPPQVTGSALAGGVLTCSDGTWDNGPTSFTRQWKRAGSDIGGATGTTYTVAGDDIGQALTCTVVATNAGGSGSATSNAVFPPASGATGPDGPTGPAGPTGPTGPAGEQGQPAFKLLLFFSSPRLKARSGRRLAVPYVATSNASVTLAIRKGGRRVGRVLGSAKRGRNTLAWRTPKAKKLKPGRYRAVLTAKGRDGQNATDRVPLTIKK